MNWRNKLNQLVEFGHWKEIRSFVGETLCEDGANSEIAIEALYLFFDRLAYGRNGEYDPEVEHQKMREIFYDLFKVSYLRFQHDADYLFFIGYFIALADWAFKENGLGLSHRMLLRATEIAPDDVLYSWGYYFSTGNPEAKNLIHKLYLDDENMERLKSKGESGKFMFECVEREYIESQNNQC